MSLPNYLAKIKSSGIYRFVWDKSQVTATEAETLRLVVGYSEKGPFNTPVYIDNTADFKTTFGDVNKKLEKRGIFFHRMALQALSAGPILALNLKKFTNDEKVQYITSDTNGQFTVSTTGVTVDKIYNTSRFWSLDPDALTELDNADTSKAEGNANPTKPYIIMTAADSVASSNSVFIRPCTSSGYDVTVKAWYSSLGEEMPDYFENYANMKISDFFAEIYVFKGQFTPAVAQSEELKKYFVVDGDTVTLNTELKDAWGNVVDPLDALAENENSNFIRKYQGVVLPNFKNSTGAYISLDLLFNADYNKHKMIMKFNSDLLDDGDITVDEITTRGWDKVTEKLISYSAKITYGDEVAAIPDDAQNIKINTLNDLNIIPKTNIYDAVTLLGANVSATSATIDNHSKGKVETVNEEGYIVNSDADIRVGYEIHTISDDPDFTLYNMGYIRLTDEFYNDEGRIDTDKVVNAAKTLFTTSGSTITFKGLGATAFANKMVNGNRYLVKCNDKIIVATLVKSVFTKGTSPTESTLALTFDHKDCQPISMQLNDDMIVTRDQSGNEADTDELMSYFILSCDKILCKGTETAPVYVKGYEKTNTKPTSNSVEDKLKWQKSLLDILNADSGTGYPGLIEALTNRTDVDYRYIVDTFESFIDEEIKASLALLAKKKDNCLLLTNFPAIKTFIKSKNTSFVDDNGTFKMKYVKQGGNPTKATSVKFSLPSADNGASWCSFNTPVVFSDGTLKTTVPAAALVSNKFMEKYSSRQPYYIVAGPTYGKLSYINLVGPDYNFSRDDLDILEPMGVNATVFAPRKGIYINSNQTAKQNPVTTLSKINVRELVIYLQDQIEDMLQNYQWEFNTQSLRDVVKAKADSILENVKANGGVYAYVNVCDETNNPDEIIANEMLVLSTSIEAGIGAGKLVQELTLYSKGKLSTSTTVSE
jgi:hypothetical protein